MSVAKSSRWKRPLWMRLAAISVLAAVAVLVYAPTGAVSLRNAAQIQFMHGMGTFACATFMNIGASAARHAPACFLSGSVLYCLPVNLTYVGGPALPIAVAQAGAGLLVAGWLVLIYAASGIDRPR